MTKPRYPLKGCTEWSQVLGEASSSLDASDPADYAWNVNFNNGNANINNQNNQGCVRAVRSASPAASECQGASGTITFRDLFNAWRQARRQKVPSANQLQFESNWADRLFDLERELNAGTWKPRPTTCFIAQKPKARQIHAPDFSDRVVHHWLVPKLEALFEPGFIHDSYANRKGKGTHAAVARLRQFVHQVDAGQGGGWYLQLDISNFFNSIHRRTLYDAIKQRLVKARMPAIVQRVTHALLQHPVRRQGVVHRSTVAERAQVPHHKRLENAAPGCGLPIGNLSSQFFANVYMDRLDQFVKHELRAKRYVRYVDDFVLVHHDRAQLETWLQKIRAFLRSELKLELKDDIRLRPSQSGIDFLGYVLYPHFTRVRARVVKHACRALHAWSAQHVRTNYVHATPSALRRIQSVWASYSGHFQQANAIRLRCSILKRSLWLHTATVHRKFAHQLEGRTLQFAIRPMEATS